MMMMMSFDAAYRMPTTIPYGSSSPMNYRMKDSYNEEPSYLGNSNSYSSSNSYSTSSGNINGVPFSYSSGTDSSSPFNSFSNIFGGGFGGGQSGILQSSINNSGPVFAPNFGSGSTYARSGDAYSNQYHTPPFALPMPEGGLSSYNNPYNNVDPNYCPPYIPMDYKEPPRVSYPPTNHYQQDYNCYEPTPIYFPKMPTYGYTPNPEIPCPPEMAPAPKFPNYPTPMNMPSLGRQITPFGRPEEMKYPPAPTFPDMRHPSEPPKAPTFYCPPPPTSYGYGSQQPVYDYPPARPNY
ncbi:MAG: hypothetical protein H2174_10785 [Vampirovibrio sp.]|nr:hypothetical protein [Vampirovibrio sp.]